MNHEIPILHFALTPFQFAIDPYTVSYIQNLNNPEDHPNYTIHLTKLLKLQTNPQKTPQTIIYLKTSPPLGLLAHQVYEISYTAPSAFHPLPPFLKKHIPHPYFLAILQSKPLPSIVLDTQEIILRNQQP